MKLILLQDGEAMVPFSDGIVGDDFFEEEKVQGGIVYEDERWKISGTDGK